MTHIGNYLKYEFSRFKGVSRVALIFVFLIPILYGGIYLHANWDPYSNLSQIKVAVVNNDIPTDFQGKHIDAGAEFEDALRSNPVFDWEFVGTDLEKAKEDLSDGRYYMVVEVPSSFSSNLVSAGEFDPKRATITLHRDDANGFIIGSLTGQAADTLAKTVDSTVSQAYFQALFMNLDTIKSSLETAADGAAQLDDGLAQAKAGVDQLNDGVTSLDTSKLDSQVTKIESALDQVDAAGVQFYDASGDLRNAARSVSGAVRVIGSENAGIKSALAPIKNYFDTTLPQLHDNAIDIAHIDADLMGEGEGSLVASLDNELSVSRDSLRKLKNNPDLVNDKEFMKEFEKHIVLATKHQADISAKLDAQAKLSADLSVKLDPELLQASAESLDNASALFDQTNQDLKDADSLLNSGLDKVDGAVGSLSDGLSQLRQMSRDFLRDAPALVGDLTRLIDGIGQLHTAMGQLSDGAGRLSDGLDTGVEQMPSLGDDQVTNLSTIMSSPVDVEQVVYHDAKFYGRGVAPMFFSIAMWIAAVSTFLVVRTISGRALASRARPMRLAFFGFGPVATIGLCGALIMAVGTWLLLGVDPIHPGLYVLVVAIASLSFMALGYAVRLLIGSPQTAVFLILLILQLPACGGIFPVSMLAPFYQIISVVAPMKYSVDALRVAISGGNLGIYWISCAILAGILAASLLVIRHLVKKRQIFRMRDLHPPMVTSTSTADYAFSVRPR